MTRTILLDTSPLGMIVNPRKFPEIKQWLAELVAAGEQVLVPEISDYELRRGLLRIEDQRGVERLDRLKADLGYLPITTAAMLQAAAFWAEARRRGRATAPEAALDGDVILAAQAVALGGNTVIATSNIGHLGRFTHAQRWEEIT